jgi:FkbM family methyltransferase
MYSKFKFYDKKDWISWVADFLISKLYLLVTPVYKEKKGVYKKIKDNNFNFKKIDSTTFDLIGIINKHQKVFRCRIFESDFEVLEQIVFVKEYEPLVELLKKEKYTPKVLIDCGANVGYTSMYLEAFFKFEKIIAIEPNSNTFEILSYNITQNIINPNVVLEKKGIWSKSTYLTENFEFRDKRAWSFSLIEDEKGGRIPVIGLNDLIQQNEITLIDILKIDIEGGEAELFREEEKVKKALAITKYIAIEIHDEFNCRTHIERILFEAGFHCFKTGELIIGTNKKI